MLASRGPLKHVCGAFISMAWAFAWSGHGCCVVMCCRVRDVCVQGYGRASGLAGVGLVQEWRLVYWKGCGVTGHGWSGDGVRKAQVTIIGAAMRKGRTG